MIIENFVGQIFLPKNISKCNLMSTENLERQVFRSRTGFFTYLKDSEGQKTKYGTRTLFVVTGYCAKNLQHPTFCNYRRITDLRITYVVRARRGGLNASDGLGSWSFCRGDNDVKNIAWVDIKDDRVAKQTQAQWWFRKTGKIVFVSPFVLEEAIEFMRIKNVFRMYIPL